MWLLFAHLASNAEEFEGELPTVGVPVELTYWQWLWFATSGWGSLLYLALLIWMVLYCVNNDPDRHIWLWIIVLIWPLGPFIYLIGRWLPSSQLKLPRFTQRWTRQGEIRKLETAALQIGNAHQYVQYGDALKNIGSREKALNAYSQALTRESKNLAALWGAAAMEFQLAQYLEAKVHLEQILEIDETYKFGDVSLLYGKTLQAFDLNDAARTHLEKHSKKWRQPEAMYLLASLYVENQQPEQARQALQNLVIDLDSSPRVIARKHLFWKSRAKRLLKKMASAQQ